jgi:hypothetical protein
MPVGQWPKTFPPLSAEQERIREDYVKYWHEVLPRRFGAIERFNHSYPVRHAPAFRRTLEIGAGIGEHYTHGHVFDFHFKLLTNPHEIEVLGNGKQRKSYLYVQDCLDAMLTVIEPAQEPFNVYNLGTKEYCTVDDSLGWICAHLGLQPRRRYTGGERGWIGDSPFIFLDTAKVRSLGWRPKPSIRDSVLRTLTFLQANHEVVAQRRSA